MPPKNFTTSCRRRTASRRSRTVLPKAEFFPSFLFLPSLRIEIEISRVSARGTNENTPMERDAGINISNIMPEFFQYLFAFFRQDVKVLFCDAFCFDVRKFFRFCRKCTDHACDFFNKIQFFTLSGFYHNIFICKYILWIKKYSLLIGSILLLCKSYSISSATTSLPSGSWLDAELSTFNIFSFLYPPFVRSSEDLIHLFFP